MLNLLIKFFTGQYMYCSNCGERTYWSSYQSGDYEVFTCSKCGNSRSVRTR